MHTLVYFKKKSPYTPYQQNYLILLKGPLLALKERVGFGHRRPKKYLISESRMCHIMTLFHRARPASKHAGWQQAHNTKMQSQIKLMGKFCIDNKTLLENNMLWSFYNLDLVLKVFRCLKQNAEPNFEYRDKNQYQPIL